MKLFLKTIKKLMVLSLILIATLLVITVVYLQHPMFGKLPIGDRLEKIKSSPNYKDGAFKNVSNTPELPEGVSMWDALSKYLFGKKNDSKPQREVPSIKTDLLSLDPNQNILIWFGHSSYFVQIDGMTILVDPVFSGSASPLPFGTKSFKGTDIYTAEELPDIDLLFISHDHYDHLDYETIKKLEPKVGKVICGLGVGAHFEHWGYDNNNIIEGDWYEKVGLSNNFNVHFTPARHFSGRGFTRNKSLWVSFVLQTPTKQIYIGGDSGYDSHFKEIGEKFGDFDLVILENGQYDEYWPNIHLLPNEILQTAKDLNAKRILPVHSSKFVLGNHPWYEPLELITQNNEKENLNIITPLIGELVDLNNANQAFSTWWRK
ncbi:MBL fold metallo-hydrolase [Geofilum rubicundum]|nr:MBL fold metallo-hydrolase [Geofilum rubicundum]